MASDESLKLFLLSVQIRMLAQCISFTAAITCRCLILNLTHIAIPLPSAVEESGQVIRQRSGKSVKMPSAPFARIRAMSFGSFTV